MNVSKGKKGSFVVLLLLFGVFSFLSSSLMPAVCGSGENWLEGWSYRKSHVIESVVGAGTNYQVRVTVDYGIGYDLGGTVYVDEKCQPDFQDIRFTADDGETELDYWMENYLDSDNATFWVEVADDLSTSDVTIYIYYGNDMFLTTSNGVDTFIFFDDFEGELSSWITENGVWAVFSGKLHSADSDDDRIRTTDMMPVENTRIRTSVEGSTERCYPLIMARYSSEEFYGYQSQWISGEHSMNMWTYLNGWNKIGLDYAVASSIDEHIYEFDLYSNTLKGYHDDTLTHSISDSTLSSAGYLGIRRGGDSNDAFSVNWIFVAKYVSPEPSHGRWGEEEGNYVPTSSSFKILDMDDTDNLYAQKQYYTAQYVVTDYDGYTEIDYAEFSITQGSTVRATFRFDQDTATFSIESGSSTWDLDVENSSYVLSGKTITMNFLISPKFNAIEERNIDITTFVAGDEGETTTRIIQTDYADVVTNLVVSGFACDDNRGNVGQTLTFSGTVYYADDPSSNTTSSSYPPDTEFTAVHVYDSKGDNQGRNNTVTNGKFSVSFSALSSVALEAYNPYLDMADPEYVDSKENPTATFISDRINVQFTVDDDLVPLNTETIFNIILVREYDSSLVSSYSYNINRDGSEFNNPHATSAFSDVSSSEVTRVYDVTNVMDNAYSLTAFTAPTDILVEWYDEDAQRNILTITVAAIVIALAAVTGLIIYNKKRKT